jgi:hypothetical protein
MFWLQFPNTQKKTAKPEDSVAHPPQKLKENPASLVAHDTATGVVLWDKRDVVSLMQQFHHSQMSLLEEHHTQNMWMRRSLAWGMLFLFCALIGGFWLLYQYFFSTKDVEKNLTREVEIARQELQNRLYGHLQNQDQRYQGELDTLHQRAREGYQSQVQFLLELQEEQRQMQKSYAEKIVALEKENFALRQNVQEQSRATNQAETDFSKSKAKMEQLEARVAELDKKMQEAQRDIRYWKGKALEKLSAEELETLKKDMQDDK